MSKLLTAFAISLPFACFAADVDNYWLAESGKTSYGTATSWSLGHMPTKSENAIIDPHSTPSGTQNIDPFIVFATGETSTYTAGNLIIQNVLFPFHPALAPPTLPSAPSPVRHGEDIRRSSLYLKHFLQLSFD